MQVTTISTAPPRAINAETARDAGGFFDHYGHFYLVDDEDFIVTHPSDENSAASAGHKAPRISISTRVSIASRAPARP